MAHCYPYLHLICHKTYRYVYLINKLQQCLQLHYLSIKAKQWIKDFLALSPMAQGYQKDRVTPYMHIMAMHMPHMIRLHGNIKQFSCQGIGIGSVSIAVTNLLYSHMNRR